MVLCILCLGTKRATDGLPETLDIEALARNFEKGTSPRDWLLLNLYKGKEKKKQEREQKETEKK